MLQLGDRLPAHRLAMHGIIVSGSSPGFRYGPTLRVASRFRKKDLRASVLNNTMGKIPLR